jgi:hypothetical protein
MACPCSFPVRDNEQPRLFLRVGATSWWCGPAVRRFLWIRPQRSDSQRRATDESTSVQTLRPACCTATGNAMPVSDAQNAGGVGAGLENVHEQADQG